MEYFENSIRERSYASALSIHGNWKEITTMSNRALILLVPMALIGLLCVSVCALHAMNNAPEKARAHAHHTTTARAGRLSHDHYGIFYIDPDKGEISYEELDDPYPGSDEPGVAGDDPYASDTPVEGETSTEYAEPYGSEPGSMPPAYGSPAPSSPSYE